MLFDNLFDRFANRFRRSLQEGSSRTTGGAQIGGRNRRARSLGNVQHGPDFFVTTNNIVAQQSAFIENRHQIIQNFATGTGPDPIERVMAYADLNASFDSSARFPPPICHPGTRIKIGDKLLTWLDNLNRKWNLIWLNGPAGTGKSAVAQTFAERCAEKGRLGASFFFSRPDDRNDPNTVIPTLVYQLANCHPLYKSLVMTQLVNDPTILGKTRRAQFQKLIVEPLSQLQTQGRQRIREPLLVVLDGLDECEGENAQREIIEMIGEVARLKNDFPLVWLVCSRPEQHLKYLFSRPDFTVQCGREELVIDAESRAEVDFYIRDGLTKIKADFSDVTPSSWPPKEQIVKLSEKASGHFGFASTSLRYIGDPVISAPVRRFDDLLSFLRGGTAVSNPLKALDALYTTILENVPKDDLPAAMQILGFFLFLDLEILKTIQGCCNFLHIDQATFYDTLRKLHSVLDVPSPKSASQTPLRFYHASFEDYLKSLSRSGRFVIKENDVRLNCAKLHLSWYKTDLRLFHTTDGLTFNGSHNHGNLPGLSWVSDDDRAQISDQIANQAEFYCWAALQGAPEWDEALLSEIHNFDFRYIQASFLDDDWCRFLNKLWEHDSSSGIIRIEPQTEVDLRLLEYMKSMVGSLWSSMPATFPMTLGPNRGKYFFLGHGPTAVICWANGHKRNRFSILNADKPPSKERIDAFRVDFKNDEGVDSDDKWFE